MPDNLRERLDDVPTVVYLAYNETRLATSGDSPNLPDLANDAIGLATLVATALPREPEALGLPALLVLDHSRRHARFDPSGRLVLPRDQDRTRWDRAAVAWGTALLHRAAVAAGPPGRFCVQAAIAAVHAEAPRWSDTD